MKNKKITVTIGIPAYNEESNIRKLLESLLSQKQINFLLKEIIVISDGSTDTTNSIVESFENPIIKLIKGRTRVSQQIRQNQLISLFKGDLLVIIEADTLPYDDKILNTLVAPFLEDNNQKIDMVTGQAISLPAKTLVEKIDSHGMQIKDNIFSEWGNGDNLYSAGGHAMKTLSRNFASKLIFPTDVPEDSYTYFRLKQLGLQMIKQQNAKAYVKRASNLKDYIRRNKKFVGGKETLKEYFPKDLVNREFAPPINLLIKHLLLAAFHSPFLTTLYLLMSLLVRLLNFGTKEFNSLYQPFNSTKNLLAEEEAL